MAGLRDVVRFRYKHAILKAGDFKEFSVPSGQRVSIMVRVGPLT
jgi:hypothetical protein